MHSATSSKPTPCRGVLALIAALASSWLLLLSSPLLPSRDGPRAARAGESLPAAESHRSGLVERLRFWADADVESGGRWVQAAAPMYNASSGFYGDDWYRCRPRGSWDWRPSPRCKEPARPFSREVACALLKGRTILIVGDSLSSEVFLGLANALADPAANELAAFYDSNSAPNALRVCGGALLLDFVRNDRLSLLLDIRVEERTWYEYPWATADRVAAADIVLLNRGAHFEHDGAVLRAVQEALEFIEAAAPDASVVWRTTPRGHLNFEATFDAAPLTADLGLGELAALPYNWGQFAAQNRQIVDLIETRFPKVAVLDVAPALGLRHDLHVDGLHYCLPGPLDHVAHALLHFLPELLNH